MKDINQYLQNILASEENCESTLKKWDDDEMLLRLDFEGSIEEACLLLLIDKSKTSRTYERLLSQLSITLRGNEVTPKVFEGILSFQGEYKESILIGLGHCPLAHYQLLQLNALNIEEALAQLLIAYIKNDIFSYYDLLSIVIPWGERYPKHLVEHVMLSYKDHSKSKDLKVILKR